MKYAALTLTFLIASTPIQAGGWLALIGSKHVGVEAGHFNEVNPGLMYQDDEGRFVGAYLNSFGNVSPVVGIETRLTDHISVNTALAVYATGPQFMPSMTARYQRLRLSVTPVYWHHTAKTVDVNDPRGKFYQQTVADLPDGSKSVNSVGAVVSLAIVF